MISTQKISKYIGDLLFVHDCVIIPNFGGFVANPNKASIKNQTVFSPPNKQLVFNKNLTRNDGLLINYVAEKENISYTEAQIEIKKYVQELTFELKNSSQFTIEKIGSFSIGKELTLQFNQDFSNNYLLNSYGLSNFSFPELVEIHHSEPEISKKIDKESINISIKRSFVRKAMISIPVILALTILPFTSKISDQVNSNKASIISFDTSTQKIEKQIEDNISIENALMYEEEITENAKPIEIEKDTIVKEIKIETPKNIPIEQKGNYYLIGGSFNNAKSAEIQKQIYEKQGYSPTVFDQGRNRFRVCMSQFENKNDANKEIVRLRNENKNLQVWLLEI